MVEALGPEVALQIPPTHRVVTFLRSLLSRVVVRGIIKITHALKTDQPGRLIASRYVGPAYQLIASDNGYHSPGRARSHHA
jgi:hypothetical protein